MYNMTGSLLFSFVFVFLFFSFFSPKSSKCEHISNLRQTVHLRLYVAVVALDLLKSLRS